MPSRNLSNIQKRISRSGHEVYVLEERALASLVNPLQEAQVWVREIARPAIRENHIAILGLGSGYHIEALLQLDPKVTCWIFHLHPELEEEFKAKIESKKWLSTGRIRLGNICDEDLISEVFNLLPPLVSFRPSWGNKVKEYNDLTLYLLGVKTDSLRKICKIHQLKNLEDNLKTTHFSENEILNFNNLIKVISQIPKDSDERKIWSLIKEIF